MSEIPTQFPVLGTPVHLLDDYLGWIISCIHQRKGGHVVTLNAEMTMQAEVNPNLAEIIHRAELVIPDGSGIVLYLQLHGKPTKRCPGIELSEALLQQAANSQHAWPVFFYGGAPGIAQVTAQIWQQKVPGLVVAGTQHGYVAPEAEPAFRQRLKDLQPRLILVGLGVPRQEYWIAEHRYLCPEAVWIGVGGSFDIWAGQKFRAPIWLRENHLEWVYRLYKEPWRWRRMLALPKFALRALAESLVKKIMIRHQAP
jgi:N-acetylglucosaminyldiphosphoundecaprenol N-acetyl-beta-D-mannosaminyltransferase